MNPPWDKGCGNDESERDGDAGVEGSAHVVDAEVSVGTLGIIFEIF